MLVGEGVGWYCEIGPFGGLGEGGGISKNRMEILVKSGLAIQANGLVVSKVGEWL